jgi:hypothetical protein
VVVAADWGDIPTWLSSVATLLALTFAAFAALATHRVYKIESERDRVAAESRRQQEAFVRRTQAALVSAWWGWSLDGWGAFVRNASETPIYQASLTVLDIHDPNVGERVDLPIVPPSAEPMFQPTELGTGLVADGRHAVDYRVEVTFTDSALFEAGRTPYLICASRVVSDARRAGLRFAVGPVPPYEGQEPVRPFVSVHGFFLTRRGRNKTIAQDLAAHYLTRTDVALSLYEIQPRPPALRSALDEVVERDPDMAAFYAECHAGDLMPSLPEMRQVWTALGRAEVELVAGAATDPVVRRLTAALQQALPAAKLPTPRHPPESGATARR